MQPLNPRGYETRPLERGESHAAGESSFTFTRDRDSRYTRTTGSGRCAMVTTIHLDDETDRWRFTCPVGHRNWEATNGHFWCQSCASAHNPEAEPVFHRLHDLSTDQDLERPEVKLVTDAGDYDDLRRSEA